MDHFMAAFANVCPGFILLESAHGCSIQASSREHAAPALRRFALLDRRRTTRALAAPPGYEITDAEDLKDGRCIVKAEVVEKGRTAAEAKEWVFVMKMQELGKYTGCWLTHRLLPAGSKFVDWRDGLPV